MSGFSGNQDAFMRQCIYCGKRIRRNLTQCPYCREAQTEGSAPAAARHRAGRGGQFRSGLLLMLLAALIQYFAGGYSPMPLPIQISSPAITYLVPLLFLGGLALSLYGVFLRVTS
jgi:hypothetical protein